MSTTKTGMIPGTNLLVKQVPITKARTTSITPTPFLTMTTTVAAATAAARRTLLVLGSVYNSCMLPAILTTMTSSMKKKHIRQGQCKPKTTRSRFSRLSSISISHTYNFVPNLHLDVRLTLETTWTRSSKTLSSSIRATSNHRHLVLFLMRNGPPTQLCAACIWSSSENSRTSSRS